MTKMKRIFALACLLAISISVASCACGFADFDNGRGYERHGWRHGGFD
jgi:hypothetical protein